MIPPTAGATLRASQILVAFVAQWVFMGHLPEIKETVGGFLIFVSTLAIILDYEIEKCISILCSCSSCRNDDNRFRQIGISDNTSWLDISAGQSRTNEVRGGYSQTPRRRRLSHSISSISLS